jgi:hypothetical protein
MLTSVHDSTVPSQYRTGCGAGMVKTFRMPQTAGMIDPRQDGDVENPCSAVGLLYPIVEVVIDVTLPHR